LQREEFKEIGHTGGQVIFRVATDQDGRRSYQVRFQHSRPVPAVIFGVYAIPQGVAIGTIQMGGIGDPWNPPPIPGCFPVFIASDSEGMFGQQCPECEGYWRCRGSPTVCPYCGIHVERHQFLSAAQQRYVHQYCALLDEALAAENDGEHVIDMDAVAEAVGKNAEKPPFYYAEESQQNKFRCRACGTVNDILGTFGYCSNCATRNDLQELEAKSIPNLRNRINAGGAYEACVKDAVAAFDSFVAQYAKQLVRRIPMTPRRKSRIEKVRFHNLSVIAVEIKGTFDIDILDGMKPEDVSFATLMFHRRHVYEHNGGEADEKYIADSGDKSVRPKQALFETQESAHRLTGLVGKMAANLHQGFHEIFVPNQSLIDRYRKQKTVGTTGD